MDDFNFEEQNDHVDERWLVSYADMMTLLFGLFVLLFSMSTMDPEKSEKIKDSTEKEFGRSEEDELAEEAPPKETKEVTEEIDQEQFVALNQEILELTSQLEAITEERDELLLQNQELMAQPAPEPQPQVMVEDNSAELKRELRQSQKQILRLQNQLKTVQMDNETDELRAQIKEMERQLASRSTDKERFNRFKRQILQLRKERDALRKQRAALSTQNDELKLDLRGHKDETTAFQKKIAQLQSRLNQANLRQKQVIGKAKSFAQRKADQLKAMERKLASVSSVQDQVKMLKDENRSLASKAAELEDKSKELASKNQELLRLNAQLKDQVQKEIQKRLDDQSRRSFMAFAINWSSRDHDIDLTIEDPKGRKFDFKKRRYNSHPGHFSLDTRRGPGAEMWQTEKLIPGRYKATYYFYNQYGNVSPAKVSGTIFTPKGSTELPMIEMDFSKNRKHEFNFQVENDGTIRILN